MSIKWSVPRMWEGRTVAVLASGPSMTKWHATMVALHDVPAIVVNNTWELLPGADILVANDAAWWRHHSMALSEFRGIKFCAQDCEFSQTVTLENSGSDGFDKNPKCIRNGGNSGYAALHIAVQAGASKVIICGFDMGMPKEGELSHWHGDHKEPLRASTYAGFELARKRFDQVSIIYEKMRVDVVNCSSGSALKCFRTGKLESEL